jgi:hypothetical protein
LYTAAALGHARAKSQLAVIYLQNGLLPNKNIIRRALYGNLENAKGRFAFLQYVSPDLLKLLENDDMTEVQFMKHFIQSESMLLLYLASQ